MLCLVAGLDRGYFCGAPASECPALETLHDNLLPRSVCGLGSARSWSRVTWSDRLRAARPDDAPVMAHHWRLFDAAQARAIARQRRAGTAGRVPRLPSCPHLFPQDSAKARRGPADPPRRAQDGRERLSGAALGCQTIARTRCRIGYVWGPCRPHNHGAVGAPPSIHPDLVGREEPRRSGPSAGAVVSTGSRWRSPACAADAAAGGPSPVGCRSLPVVSYHPTLGPGGSPRVEWHSGTPSGGKAPGRPGPWESAAARCLRRRTGARRTRPPKSPLGHTCRAYTVDADTGGPST
eukprot:scaffold7496_cov444-Prasinococcus_capsulatus_cf.AAC.2